MDREKVLNSIKEKTPIRVSIIKDNITHILKVIPTKINSDDLIIGTIEKTNTPIVFGLSKVLKEATTGIKVSQKNLNKMDVNTLAKVSEKTQIEITEADEEGSFNVSVKEPEIENEANVKDIDISNNINMAKENLIAWATQKNIDLDKFSDLNNNNGEIVSKLFVKNQPHLVFIQPNGNIKIGGHKVESYDTFSDLIDFFYSV